MPPFYDNQNIPVLIATAAARVDADLQATIDRIEAMIALEERARVDDDLKRRAHGAKASEASRQEAGARRYLEDLRQQLQNLKSQRQQAQHEAERLRKDGQPALAKFGKALQTHAKNLAATDVSYRALCAAHDRVQELLVDQVSNGFERVIGLPNPAVLGTRYTANKIAELITMLVRDAKAAGLDV